MKAYLVLFCLLLIGCTIENVEEEETYDFKIPETQYVGPLSGAWVVHPLNGLTIAGEPTQIGFGSVRLFSNWDLSISIVDIDNFSDCIATGQWYFDPPGVFHFNITATTNEYIVSPGVYEANYIYTNDPQGLFVEYDTDLGNIITLDCTK